MTQPIVYRPGLLLWARVDIDDRAKFRPAVVMYVYSNGAPDLRVLAGTKQQKTGMAFAYADPNTHEGRLLQLKHPTYFYPSGLTYVDSTKKGEIQWTCIGQCRRRFFLDCGDVFAKIVLP